MKCLSIFHPVHPIKLMLRTPRIAESPDSALLLLDCKYMVFDTDDSAYVNTIIYATSFL